LLFYTKKAIDSSLAPRDEHFDAEALYDIYDDAVCRYVEPLYPLDEERN